MLTRPIFQLRGRPCIIQVPLVCSSRAPRGSHTGSGGKAFIRWLCQGRPMRCDGHCPVVRGTSKAGSRACIAGHVVAPSSGTCGCGCRPGWALGLRAWAGHRGAGPKTAITAQHAGSSWAPYQSTHTDALTCKAVRKPCPCRLINGVV